MCINQSYVTLANVISLSDLFRYKAKSTYIDNVQCVCYKDQRSKVKTNEKISRKTIQMFKNALKNREIRDQNVTGLKIRHECH